MIQYIVMTRLLGLATAPDGSLNVATRQVHNGFEPVVNVALYVPVAETTCSSAASRVFGAAGITPRNVKLAPAVKVESIEVAATPQINSFATVVVTFPLSKEIEIYGADGRRAKTSFTIDTATILD